MARQLGAPAGVLPNDSDSGVIGQAQYNTWKLNFGQVSGSSGCAAINRFVPEPSSLSLLMGAAALLAATTTQRVRSPLPWRLPGDA